MLRGHSGLIELTVMVVAVALALFGVRPYSELAYWVVHEVRLLSYRFRGRALPR
jgi:hypothetical protein